tara:strand:+ start:103 stop:249 length:147 start_codon:yes stop_codon:yes gene_type:complete
MLKIAINKDVQIIKILTKTRFLYPIKKTIFACEIQNFIGIISYSKGLL